MRKSVTVDESHLTPRVANDLPDDEAEVGRTVPAGDAFMSRLRRAVRAAAPRAGRRSRFAGPLGCHRSRRAPRSRLSGGAGASRRTDVTSTRRPAVLYLAIRGGFDTD